MSNEIAERSELSRMADDGCPQVSGESQLYDLDELWSFSMPESKECDFMQ